MAQTTQERKPPRQSANLELAVPPQNLNAERSVIASMLLDNRCYDDVADIVRKEHFYADVHGTLFAETARLIDGGKPADAITLAEALEQRGLFEDIGGGAYLIEVLEAVPHAAHAITYANIVRETWMQRQLQQVCQDTLRNLTDAAADSTGVLEDHERAVFALTDQRSAANKEQSFEAIVEQTLIVLEDRFNHPDAVPGLSSGFVDLDQIIDGFRGGQLVILAARPSMGKTAFVVNLSDWFIQTGQPTLFFSLEQSRIELAERFLCVRGRLAGKAVRRGILEPHDRHALLEAASELQKQPLWIDDTAERSVAEIRSISRRIKRKHGLQVIVVDYLQLIEPESKSKNSNRENDVAQISRRLKGLAKDLDVPVIVLSQLNRNVELREDKRPRLADLRESGAIEQDADIVMFLHRPEAYDPQDQPGIAEVVIAKNRSGETGIVRLNWTASQMRFANAEPVADPAERF